MKSFNPILVMLVAAFVLPKTGVAQTQQLTAERLFASDRVTDIKIELAEKDWDQIRGQSRSFAESLTKQPAVSPFTYVKGNVTIDGVLIKDVGIRKKGFLGSLNSERPSLKIKFEEYVEQTPVVGLDRLTLNNNNQDASRMCQYMSYKMFRDSGTISPRCGFAKVSVNGKYLGLYSNVEPIKPPFLRNAFGDDSGALFEGTVADFFPEWTQKFELKNDAADVSHVQKVAEVFGAEDFDLDELNQVVDVDAFINFWAMESLLGFWDGYCSNQNNYYLYQNANNGKFYFIPWGTDSAFTNTSPIPPYQIRPRSVHAKAILPNRLYRKDETQKSYVATLMSFLDEHWQEEKMLAEFDRLEQLLKPHLLEDNREFDRVLSGYRRFIKNRRDQIMAEFKNGPPKLKSKEHTPVYFETNGTVEITFSTQWFDRDPKKVPGTGEVSVVLIVDGNEVELKDLGVYAKNDDRDKNNASIIVIGTRVSNGRTIIIGTGMQKNEFKPSASQANVGGILIQPGLFGMIGAKTRMMFGTVRLEKASMNKGDPVKGTMSLSVVEMKSGPVE